ncbi:copper amine oxidase N-terminal domain-containing protein [Paenibacillus germinis]|nr:copper amine oxidase N-terminal domain-containing protein [Paenibacillus germinis]
MFSRIDCLRGIYFALFFLLSSMIASSGNAYAHPLLLSKSEWTLTENQIEVEILIDKYLAMRLAYISEAEAKLIEDKKISEYVPPIQPFVDKEISVWVNGTRLPLRLKATEDTVSAGIPCLSIRFTTGDIGAVAGEMLIKVEFGLFFQITDNAHMNIAHFMFPSHPEMEERMNFTAEKMKWEGKMAPRTKIVLAVDSPYLYVNDRKQQLDPHSEDTTPLLINERVLLPIRSIIEALGGTVAWNEDDRKVSIRLEAAQIDLWIDNYTASINGIETDSEEPPRIINGNAYLPIRFIAETLGLQVQWINSTREIIISYEG